MSAPARTKTFVGPKLRRLRKERDQTQAQMATALGISPTYVNLLENNQRSLSLQVLMRFSDVYGVDWRELIEDDGPNLLADLRNATQDPIFGNDKPDLQELRSALDHCPKLARSLLNLHDSYRALSERMLALTAGGQTDNDLFGITPEATVHDLFRRYRNHFPTIEAAAQTFSDGETMHRDEVYTYLKERMSMRYGIKVVPVSVAEQPDMLRYYDENARQVFLSDALDYQNRVFQLTHVMGLLEYHKVFDALIEQAEITEPRGQARARVELASGRAIRSIR